MPLSPEPLRASPPFLAIPSARHLVRTAIWGLLLTLWFGAIYGLCDYLTGLRGDRMLINFPWERQIPFVPQMLVAYMSIYPLFWLGPFVLRTAVQIQAIIVTLAWLILLAGIGFLLLPAELAFARPEVPPAWLGLYNIADRLNLDYNLAPSLHVALSLCCADVYAAQTSRLRFKLALGSWAAAIAASTVLIHEHHVLDVLLGAALGVAGSRLLYPWLRVRGLAKDTQRAAWATNEDLA